MNIPEHDRGGLSGETVAKIVGLITVLAPTAKIILYGSRAQNRYRERSDIDIALDAGSPIALELLGEVHDVLENTLIPQKFDVVDIHTLPERFKQEVLAHGRIWKH